MTKIDLQTIVIDKLIVHDLPRHKKDDFSAPPNYSQQESSLPDGMRLFFKDKIVQALISDRSFKIIYDPESLSPVSWQVTNLLTKGNPSFVDASKTITHRLFEIQVGNNASGILVFIIGRINTKPAFIILKLERDEGAQLKLNDITKTFDIAAVYDLMLTKKTKIFKVALFMLRDDFKIKYDGLIMDYQIDVKAKTEVITFFIDKFLGCKPFDDPKLTTQKFYNLTRAYINTFEDDLEKAKGFQDLNSYIQKNDMHINPKEFADDYMKTKQKTDYQAFLREKHFRFGQSPKDTHLIDAKIKHFLIDFENGVTLISKKGALGKNVKIEAVENGMTRAVVTSRIKKIQ